MSETGQVTREAIEAGAIALWQEDNIRCMGKPRLIDWVEVAPADQDRWRAKSCACLIAAARMMRPSESDDVR